MSGSEKGTPEKAPDRRRASGGSGQGAILPIGGAEDKELNGTESILRRFVELAGGKKADILVIPTASQSQEEMGEQYIKVFGKLGARSVNVLNVQVRKEANEQAAIDQVAAASGIFITGGAQDALVSLLCGTQVMEGIRARNADGIVVAGTSAGASVLAAHMMLGGTGLAGDSGGAAARKNMVELTTGFGLLQDIIVDQHFSERGRMGD